jgi:hypothetical protein
MVPYVWAVPWPILQVHWSDITSQLHQPSPVLHFSSNMLHIIVFMCNVIYYCVTMEHSMPSTRTEVK